MNSSIGLILLSIVRQIPEMALYHIVTILKSISFVAFILLKYLQKEVIGCILCFLRLMFLSDSFTPIKSDVILQFSEYEE